MATRVTARVHFVNEEKPPENFSARTLSGQETPHAQEMPE